MIFQRNTPAKLATTVGLACLTVILLVPSSPVEGQVSLGIRAMSMMTKLVSRGFKTLSRVDYATLARNAKTFVETALTAKELYDLYQHMTNVDKKHRTSQSMNAHVENCPVCNEFFCALTKGTRHAHSVPLLYGLERNEVLIRNPTKRTIQIALRSTSSDWKNFSIAAGRSFEFKRADRILLSTKSSTGRVERVEYRLEQQRKYRLAWSDSKRRWDIFRISG